MSNILDTRVQNKNLQKSLAVSIEELFPISSNGKTLTITDVTIEDTLDDTDFPLQKEIKLQ